MADDRVISKLGLMVVIAVAGYGFVLVLLSSTRFKNVGIEMVCSTNLKGLGTAMIIYANDYDDAYPKLGQGPWSEDLGFLYDEAPLSEEGPRTITSSLYLLVREVDVSPKTFVCPESDRTEFDGANFRNKDLVELWDFGGQPHDHVSYAYHNPYGSYPPNAARSAAFALMADMSPWFEDGEIVLPGTLDSMPPQVIQYADPTTWRLGNSLNHRPAQESLAEGQNVLYADGHVSYETQPNVGVSNDNIYTYWSAGETPTEQERQGGTAPTSRLKENDAQSEEDSFLAI